MKLFIRDIVPDTYTNAAGYTLLTVLKNYFVSNQPITLSFKDATPPSSSFLNSSIGELLDQFGFAHFKSIIKFTDLTTTQVQVLKNYFSTCDTKS
jgi:hypothetical protein